MSESTGNAQPSKGPETGAQASDAEIITTAPVEAKKERKQNNRRSKREIYNDEFEAVGTYHAGGPQGGDFDILKVVGEHEHEDEKRLELITRSREAVAGDSKIVIGRVFAPIEEVEIFPVSDSENDYASKTPQEQDELIKAHGHAPSAYRRYQQDISHETEFSGPGLANHVWDLPRYGQLSTLEAYLQSRGLEALASSILSKPKTAASDTAEPKPNQKEADSSRANTGDTTDSAPDRKLSPIEDIKNDLRVIKNHKVGKFVLKHTPKRKPQPYWKIHGMRDLQELMKPREEQPAGGEQLAFDFDKPDSKNDVDSKSFNSEADTKVTAKTEPKLPEVDLNNSWKGMDPIELEKNAPTETVNADDSAPAKPPKGADKPAKTPKPGKLSAVGGFFSGARMAKQETSRHKAGVRVAMVVGALALLTVAHNNEQALKQQINNQWAEIQANDNDPAPQTSAPSAETKPAEGAAVTEPSTETVPTTTQSVPEVAPDSTPVNPADIHDSNGVPQPQPVLEVVKDTSVANEIGIYAHSIQNLKLSDSQKQQIYEQLHAEFGNKIIDIAYDSKNVYEVGSNLFLNSTGHARWFNPAVQRRVDALIREAVSS